MNQKIENAHEAFVKAYNDLFVHIRDSHYRLATKDKVYRYVSLTLLGLTAPIVLLLIWAPAILMGLVSLLFDKLCGAFELAFELVSLYITELVKFYRYLPAGYNGAVRHEPGSKGNTRMSL